MKLLKAYFIYKTINIILTIFTYVLTLLRNYQKFIPFYKATNIVFEGIYVGLNSTVKLSKTYLITKIILRVFMLFYILIYLEK